MVVLVVVLVVALVVQEAAYLAVEARMEARKEAKSEVKLDSDLITQFQGQILLETIPLVNSDPKKHCANVMAQDPEKSAEVSRILTKKTWKVNTAKEKALAHLTTAARSHQMKSTSQTTIPKKRSTRCLKE